MFLKNVLTYFLYYPILEQRDTSVDLLMLINSPQSASYVSHSNNAEHIISHLVRENIEMHKLHLQAQFLMTHSLPLRVTCEMRFVIANGSRKKVNLKPLRGLCCSSSFHIFIRFTLMCNFLTLRRFEVGIPPVCHSRELKKTKRIF